MKEWWQYRRLRGKIALAVEAAQEEMFRQHRRMPIATHNAMWARMANRLILQCELTIELQELSEEMAKGRPSWLR